MTVIHLVLFTPNRRTSNLDHVVKDIGHQAEKPRDEDNASDDEMSQDGTQVYTANEKGIVDIPEADNIDETQLAELVSLTGNDSSSEYHSRNELRSITLSLSLWVYFHPFYMFLL